MVRRRLAAAALAALAAALFTVPGVASGARAGDQALVRVAHFAPGLLKGDVYVIRDAAAAVWAVGGVAAGSVVQQRRSSG